MTQTKSAYGGSVIVSSEGMHETAERIAILLKGRDMPIQHVRAEYTKFANGEVKPWIPETVRGEHVFFLHPLQDPDPNTAIMLMLLTADALKRASVSGITLVLPYLPYLRQDRKDKPRVPISARLLADLIESNEKVDRVITLDMHADQEQGFFSIPVDNINARGVHADYFRKRFDGDFSNVIVVAPDFGGAVRARRFATRLGEHVPVSIIDKRRPGPNEVEVIGFVGEGVDGRDVILYDDMIDTGGTIRAAVAEIKGLGARSIRVCATHALLSADAAAAFQAASCSVVVTPSIPRPEDYWKANASWLDVVSIDELLTSAIHEASLVGGSISKLSS
jgi:ribose-phosphate pyrophosphokinase